MSEAEFAIWALRICLTALIIFLGFIIWNLGKESKVGKFGMFILFLVLGLGIAGFLMKELIVGFFMHG
ncbi:DUF2788 domain-containing protein [Neisseriaceae bacterium B1]